MNQKNLNYEIETSTAQAPDQIGIDDGTMNQKNLNYEIETLIIPVGDTVNSCYESKESQL